MRFIAIFLVTVLSVHAVHIMAEEAPSKPAAGGSTLKGDRWTPVKDSSGNIAQAEWDGLPLNRWIEWMGTSMESQLTPPFGAPAGYTALGNSPTQAHYNAFTGAGWDEKNGRFYHFGGGHADGGNNMLTCFDVAKGTHSVVISPTPKTMMPEGYKVNPGNQNLSNVGYPSGKYYQYFPSKETPAGDDKPCASHEWSGIVFIPGINEVLLPRFGWFHAQLDSKTWRVGPQTVEADRKGFTNRGGIAFQAHYLPSTGLVYLTSEGGQISQNAGYYSIVKYDPVKRTEVGVMAWDAGGYLSTSCMAGDLMWYFQGDGNKTCQVTTVNLAKDTPVRGRTDCTGRRPNFGDGENPVQYIPDLDKVLMWCTVGRKDEAQSGEVLEFNRATLAFSSFPVAGTPPAAPRNMNNKVRYWPAQKVLVFQLATNVNARVIKLAR